ncbi:hypothetical protein LBMAG53_11280 [Planctomycetota bacterium]|nr:hypothetical protein LBMAG53_11280 [Planctomycetota bacterium]
MIQRLLTLVFILGWAGAIEGDLVPDGPGRMHGWVPEDVPVLRGIYLEDGSMCHEQWAEVLQVLGWAYLRSARNVYNGNHGALLRSTVNHLAERTGHPELPNLPFCTMGYSRFSGIHKIVIEGYPNQLLTFANGWDLGANESEGLRTPNVKVANEIEDLFSMDRSRGAQSLGPPWNRAEKGPLRCFHIAWRMGHSNWIVQNFMMAYQDQLHRLRVPADWDPLKGPPKLRVITEPEGWLADNSGFWRPVKEPVADDLLIAAYADYPAERRAFASWLPDRETAWLYRAACSRYPWGKFTQPCEPWLETSPTGVHNALGLKAGTPAPVSIRLDIPDAAKVELFAWSQPVGSTTTFIGGELGTTRNATASLTWTPSSSRIWPLLAKVTRTDGRTGWLHPIVLPVHPAREL